MTSAIVGIAQRAANFYFSRRFNIVLCLVAGVLCFVLYKQIAGPGVQGPSDAQESSTAPATLPPPAISPVPAVVQFANPSATAPQGPTLRHMRVTAYCPCERCCGSWADGITASGTKADHPLVAAPKSFAFGTRLRIPGYNDGDWVTVEDRGGAIKGDRLDVFFPTHGEALEWGVQWLDVEVEESK